MFDIVPPYQHELTATINAGMVDHGQSRLTAARACIAQSLSAKPLYQPQCQGQDPKDGDEGKQHLQGIRAFAEQHVNHYSSPTQACRQGCARFGGGLRRNRPLPPEY
jgi:hypothetical protein